MIIFSIITTINHDYLHNPNLSGKRNLILNGQVERVFPIEHPKTTSHCWNWWIEDKYLFGEEMMITMMREMIVEQCDAEWTQWWQSRIVWILAVDKTGIITITQEDDDGGDYALTTIKKRCLRGSTQAQQSVCLGLSRRYSLRSRPWWIIRVSISLVH